MFCVWLNVLVCVVICCNCICVVVNGFVLLFIVCCLFCWCVVVGFMICIGMIYVILDLVSCWLVV